MKTKIPLHSKILIGLALGVAWGFISAWQGWPPSFTSNFIEPFGTIFVRLLKMIALPLVLASLIVGVSSLSDVKKLSRMGGKTIFIYLATTVLAITIGLVIGNLIRPGETLPQKTRDQLMATFGENTSKALEGAESLKDISPLQPLVDMVPDNIVSAAGNNTAMLQVVLFAVLAGVALISIPKEKAAPVIAFFDGLNELTIKLVDFIMVIAPIGVFALMGSLIVDIAGDDPGSAFELLAALFWYSLTVVSGLAIMVFVVYPILLRLFTKLPVGHYFRAIRPVQLLAFSTSSSNATLPLTMERCEKNMGASEEVCSFVLPLGATVNMDGTSLYQGVAALFIAQALNIPLDFTDQLMIVLTATLASIGSAGVPGAGLVMLVIVLESIGVPTSGIALILAVDRILDMCRTVVNVTGDTMVCAIIAQSENALHPLAEVD